MVIDIEEQDGNIQISGCSRTQNLTPYSNQTDDNLFIGLSDNTLIGAFPYRTTKFGTLILETTISKTLQRKTAIWNFKLMTKGRGTVSERLDEQDHGRHDLVQIEYPIIWIVCGDIVITPKLHGFAREIKDLRIQIEGKDRELCITALPKGTYSFTIPFKEGHKPEYIACADGTLIVACHLRKGWWDFRLCAKGTSIVSLRQSEKNKEYVDMVVLDGHVDWIVMGNTLVNGTTHIQFNE